MHQPGAFLHKNPLLGECLGFSTVSCNHLVYIIMKFLSLVEARSSVMCKYKNAV